MGHFDKISGIWCQFGVNFVKFHCVKRVGIRSYSGPYFPVFELNAERYGEVRIFPYSVQLRETTDQNNCEYGHFLRSV